MTLLLRHVLHFARTLHSTRAANSGIENNPTT